MVPSRVRIQCCFGALNGANIGSSFGDVPYLCLRRCLRRRLTTFLMVSALRDVPVPAQSPRPSRSRASNKSELATCPVPRLRPAAECRSAVTLLDVLEVGAVDDPDLAADKSAGLAMAPAVPR